MAKISQARAYHPDVILMDLWHAVMDGFEANLSAWPPQRTIRAHIPIIALTGSTWVDLIRCALCRWFYQTLRKPTDWGRNIWCSGRSSCLLGDASSMPSRRPTSLNAEEYRTAEPEICESVRENTVLFAHLCGDGAREAELADSGDLQTHSGIPPSVSRWRKPKRRCCRSECPCR